MGLFRPSVEFTTRVVGERFANRRRVLQTNEAHCVPTPPGGSPELLFRVGCPVPVFHGNTALGGRRAARCLAKRLAEDVHLGRAMRKEVTAALAVVMGRSLPPRLLPHCGPTLPGDRPEPLLLRVGRPVPALHSNAALIRGRSTNRSDS